MKKVTKHKALTKSQTLSQKIVHALILYTKTQLLLAILISTASWILLSLLGVRFALLLAILTGVLSVIPVFGNAISAIAVALVATFDGARFLPNLPEILEGVSVLIIYGVLNISIDYFLSPYLTGKLTKVHPLLLLLAVIAGTIFFGIPGALFAVPVVLVVKTVLNHYK